MQSQHSNGDCEEWGRLFTYNLFTMDIYVFEKSKEKKLIYNIYNIKYYIYYILKFYY